MDVVMENRRRDVVGVEIKAAATVADADFRGLHAFADLAGKRLRADPCSRLAPLDKQAC
jgi:hypothetical protein